MKKNSNFFFLIDEERSDRTTRNFKTENKTQKTGLPLIVIKVNSAEMKIPPAK